MFLTVPWGAFSWPTQALFILFKRTQKERKQKLESLPLIMNLTKEKVKKKDLERDEIDEDLKGLGLEEMLRQSSFSVEGVCESWAQIRRSNWIFNWSTKAPIRPCNREHYQFRSHVFQNPLMVENWFFIFFYLPNIRKRFLTLF